MPKRRSVYHTMSSGSCRVVYLDRELAVQILRERAEQLVRTRPKVLEVRLFGSLAEGTAVPGSDADILIVLRDHPLPRWFDRIPLYAPAFDAIDMPVELFCYTLDELRQLEEYRPGFAGELRRATVLATREGQADSSAAG